jgi:prepilin-type N-terminal cleavage/methylation domain-containing protein
MRPTRRGFTLIEILVVVAIIALLISVLLPSLKRARDQAKLVACKSNLHMLTVAFMAYSTETRGYLPGCSEDPGADWLGGSNVGGTRKGRQPEDGGIYRYMGASRDSYMCPSDDVPRATGLTRYSYTSSTLMSGAAAASVGLAHYRYSINGTSNYSTKQHSTEMRSTPAFVLVEEEPNWYLLNTPNSAWDNDDGITNRHVGRSGSVGCLDGSVGHVSLPSTPRLPGKFFSNNSMCVRYRSKWVSGNSWVDFTYDRIKNPKGAYRLLERAQDAGKYGVIH